MPRFSHFMGLFYACLLKRGALLWDVPGSKYGEKQMYNDAGQDAKRSWKNDGQDGPAPASGFLSNRQTGGGTGPVKQGKQDKAQGGFCGPAVCGKQCGQVGKRAGFRQSSGGEIPHQGQRQDDFIGREAKKKSQKNGAVQSDAAGKRLAKLSSGLLTGLITKI